MKALNQYPMARILFPFMGGIVLAPILPSSVGMYLIALLVLLVAFIFWLFALKKYSSYKTRWISGFFLSTLFLILGIIGFWYNSPLNRQNHYTNFDHNEAYLIKIESPFSETAKTYKSIGQIKAVFVANDSSWKTTNGRIILYFQKQEEFQLNYGDEIICTSILNPIQGAQNPHAFDYRKYMQRKGIFDQTFIKENEWKKIESTSTFSLQSVAIQLRTKLLNILDNLQYDSESRALAAALLIGYDEYLDDNLRDRFSGSGAMHILCVSGLHVGIVFMLSNFLFGFLGKIRFGNEFKTILILAIIWFYALITGLSPSVMRASTMFTFMIVGKLFNRKGNTYNSLAASALLLLLIDPNLIYNIGFQLSYGAVFAIVYIQPKLFKLLYFKNILLSKIWALLGVSIAAQIGTFPLAIYYFHQFPNYFLLTNLWVIPLAFIIVSGGVIVLLIGLVGLSSSILGVLISNILNFSLISLNKGVEIINLLPYAVSENLALNKLEVLLIYFMLFSVSTLFLYKKRIWFFPTFSVVLLLITSFVITSSSNLKSNTWVVYKTNGSSAMDFIFKQKSVLIGDSTFVNNPQKHKFILTENHIKSGIKEKFTLQKLQMDSSNLNTFQFHENLILFQSLRILYLDKPEADLSFENPLPIDFVVIAKDAKVNLVQLSQQYSFSTIIFDSSNHWWRIKQLKQEADTLGIPYWDVNQKGAFVFKIKKAPENIRGFS